MEAKPYEMVKNSQDASFVYECLRSKRAIKIAVEKQIIEIIGPLDARERWNLLIEAHFPDLVRSKIYTGDPPWAVAYKLVDSAISYGYPANVYLLQLAGVENIQVEGFDTNRVQQAMSSLLVNAGTMTDALRQHENSR